MAAWVLRISVAGQLRISIVGQLRISIVGHLRIFVASLFLAANEGPLGGPSLG